METLQANSRAKEVLLSAFPSYSGRKFHVREIHFPMSLTSYWDGGSRSDYAIVSLRGGVVRYVGENGGQFCGPRVVVTDKEGSQDAGRWGGETETVHLPEDQAVAEHCIFRGKDLGLRLYVRAGQIEEFRRQPVHEDADLPAPPATLRENPFKGTHELRFEEKPPAWVRTALKKRGWRWSGRDRCWWKRRSSVDLQFVFQFTRQTDQAA